MILAILLTIAVGCGAEEFVEPRTWQCDGGVNYYDAPMVFYYNVSKSLCYAGRKGCLPEKVNNTYPGLLECLKANYNPSRTITQSFMCENQLYNKKIFTFTVAGQQFYPILSKCDITERFCPQGYVCSVMSSNGVASCCSLTEDSNNENYIIKNKYDAALLKN